MHSQETRKIPHTRYNALLNLEIETQRILKLISLKVGPKVMALQSFRHFSHQKQVLRSLIKNKQPIQMVLPAFPAKSPNPNKTMGHTPDFGEILALQKLNDLCEAINKIYQPGARVVICSDGRVFSDLVLVTDQDVNEYSQVIQNVIEEFEFSNLSLFNLEDYFTDISFDDMRSHLVNKYAEPLEDLKVRVKTDKATQHLFNGIHRFMTEDYHAIHKSFSKNYLRKLTKNVAYQVIQRSNAWSRLVEKQFPDALRLSIHPQLGSSKKLGVQLVDAPNQWRTPWHAVVLSDGNRHVLVKSHEAKAMGAEVKRHAGKYSYYFVDSIEEALAGIQHGG